MFEFTVSVLFRSVRNLLDFVLSRQSLEIVKAYASLPLSRFFFKVTFVYNYGGT